jgi:hypothetical protein
LEHPPCTFGSNSATETKIIIPKEVYSYITNLLWGMIVEDFDTTTHHTV